MTLYKLNHKYSIAISSCRAFITQNANVPIYNAEINIPKTTSYNFIVKVSYIINVVNSNTSFIRNIGIQSQFFYLFQNNNRSAILVAAPKVDSLLANKHIGSISTNTNYSQHVFIHPLIKSDSLFCNCSDNVIFSHVTGSTFLNSTLFSILSNTIICALSCNMSFVRILLEDVGNFNSDSVFTSQLYSTFGSFLANNPFKTINFVTKGKIAAKISVSHNTSKGYIISELGSNPRLKCGDHSSIFNGKCDY